MSTIYCDECRRPNGASAKKCIWCGAAIVNGSASGAIETTRVEIGYLDGIERIEDAGPVRLIISAEGIEVVEVMPGTRSVKIAASSIIESNVVDASAMIEGKRVRPTWWWMALGPLALVIPGRKTPAVKEHDYILTIKYQAGNETRNAVFHREDRVGLAVVEGLARIVESLVRQNGARAEERRSGGTGA
jgi:hypothetical protein